MCVLQPGAKYHLYNYAIGDGNLFREESNYLYFLKRYAFFIHPVAETFAYCLMPNHFHLLIQVREKTELGKAFPDFESLEKLVARQFANLFSTYTQAYNKLYERKGPLFSKSLKRELIADETKAASVIHYIHHNPVHHGFSSSVSEWYWSSYHTYLNNKKTLLQREKTLEWFGGKKEFIKFHRNAENIHPYATVSNAG